MREILFRGKRVDNGEWVEGSYFATFPDTLFPQIRYYLRTEEGEPVLITIDVLTETVGQYTGLTDKNGTKIFEGDIVKVYEDIDYRIGTHKSNRKTRTIIGVVVFDEKRFEYHIKNEEYNLTLFRLSKRDTNEIIGNIHDNPELLQRSDNNVD